MSFKFNNNNKSVWTIEFVVYPRLSAVYVTCKLKSIIILFKVQCETYQKLIEIGASLCPHQNFDENF